MLSLEEKDRWGVEDNDEDDKEKEDEDEALVIMNENEEILVHDDCLVDIVRILVDIIIVVFADDDNVKTSREAITDNIMMKEGVRT
jgi:hypothetical protein